MTPTIMHVNLAKGFRGGERQTELLIKELATHGLKQYLVCRDNTPLREHLKAVSNLEFITANHQLMGHFAVHQNIDMIHAHEAKAVHWAWIENRLRGTPYILTRRVPQQIKQNLFNKLCYKHASQTVAISSPIASYLAGLQLAPVTTIPSALAHLPHNPDISKEIKKQYPGKFLIGHAGALVDKHKGQREIIKAATQLEAQAPNIHFIMLGDGPDGEQFREESKQLSNMEWLGFKQNPGDYFAALDLFVFPSRNEGLGSTLLDVMDFKVPIIASDVDGIPDIVKHEQTGLLIPVNNANALATAILRLCNDKLLREQLATTAKEKLADFTPAAMAKRYLTLYRSLLSKRPITGRNI